jgi:hypothetical protein
MKKEKENKMNFDKFKTFDGQLSYEGATDIEATENELSGDIGLIWLLNYVAVASNVLRTCFPLT